MSIASWTAEFYPTPAKDCPPEEATAHSLRKWRGLRDLEKHGLTVNNDENLTDGHKVFWITASTCALCEHFYSDEWCEPRCPKCPLAIARGGVPCDVETATEKYSPWAAWGDCHSPEPMIAALEKAAEVSA